MKVSKILVMQPILPLSIVANKAATGEISLNSDPTTMISNSTSVNMLSTPDLTFFVQIVQIILLAVLTFSVYITYRSLQNQTKQQRADFHIEMDKFRNTNKNFRLIRKLLYEKELEEIKLRIKRLSITNKLDFLNFYDFIYALVQSDLMSISAADNYFGALVKQCRECPEFWIGLDEKNRFKIKYNEKGEPLFENNLVVIDDPKAKNFQMLYEEMMSYRAAKEKIGEFDDPLREKNLIEHIQFWWVKQKRIGDYERLHHKLQHNLDSVEWTDGVGKNIMKWLLRHFTTRYLILFFLIVTCIILLIISIAFTIH